jgi:hypothetical protein
MSIEFPKKGQKLDIVAYYRLSTTLQNQAKTWLEVNGTEQEKALFSKTEEVMQKQIAEQNKQDQAQAELRANMREAPNKHGTKKKKPGGGSCSVQ